MFKGKKYITFDCYGTLIDWEGGIREALKKISEKNGFNLDLSNISDKYIRVELEVEAEQYRKYHEVLQLSAKKLLKQVGFDAIWINRNNEKPTTNIRPDLEFKDLRPLSNLLP